MVSRAGPAPPASRSPRAIPSTCTSSMRLRTTASTPCATWWRTHRWARRGAGRSTSSTRSTCCRPRPPTRCSRHWRSRRATSCSSWPRPTRRRCRRRSAVGRSTSSSASWERTRCTACSSRSTPMQDSTSTRRRSRRPCGAGEARPAMRSRPWTRSPPPGSADAARPELAEVLNAVADGDVSQVLVALNTLLAGGWGPQQLATELIDDLRQVFLAALAPELCAVSGSSLEHFRSLAETMGLARVVRSMEILGHALVDMREAPDAQVVLEIAVVRAVRPDLDSGMEALSERVSVLERSRAGAAAFPRPGGSGTEAGAAPAVPAPGPSGSEQPASGRPAGDVGRRPSIGAVRRSQQAAGAPASATPAPPVAEAPPPEVATPTPAPAPRGRRRTGGGTRSTVTASPRPGATGSSGRSRPVPRRCTAPGASSPSTTTARTSRCPTPPTGTGVPSWSPRSRRRSSRTSARR